MSHVSFSISRMPSKNILKTWSEQEYYHIYNRGVNKCPIFLEDSDKDHFLKLFDRYLNPENHECDCKYNQYQKYDKELEILCFCLMNNHFHFLIYLKKGNNAISEMMQKILTSYTMYFNKKYDRVGPLFQSRYKSSRITSDPYLVHISRYIHLNPQERFNDYKYSSFRSYILTDRFPWLKPRRILELFKNVDYAQFVSQGLLDNHCDAFVDN